MSAVSNKPYEQMSDAELHEALACWLESVATSPGWSSAYFSAQELKHICAIGNKRGLAGFENPYPIRIGR